MAVSKKFLSNHSFFNAALFVIFLFLFEEYHFDVPQIKFFRRVIMHYSGKELWIAFVSAIASFLICWLFVQAALRSTRTFQVLYICLFTISLPVEYGFWRSLHRFMIPADLKVANATPVDIWKSASVLFFDWWFILPVIAFIFWLFIFGKRQTLKISLIRFVSLFLFITVLNYAYSFSYLTTNFNWGLSFSSFYQMMARFLVENTFSPEREMLGWSHSQMPQNNIVLIIDESIRADHLSINGYERKTTPFLDQFAEIEVGFHNLGTAASGGTCSYISNTLLLTGVRPGLDDFQQTKTYPTVFQYAKAMGYKTYYMDVQTSILWNGLTDRDIPFVDSWFKVNDFGYGFDGDFRAADLIVKIASEGSGNFIVLNKKGVHFLYENSYPPEEAVWLPLPKNYISEPDLSSNPYDNGILYNVNTFFERLLVNPKILENTTILYTSDHGATLFENHVTWPQCNYSLQEARVPLILIGENLSAVNGTQRASHSNILPTLLDLMGVPPEERLHIYAPSLFSPTEKITTDRFFFDGSLRLVDFPDP
jgi:glucan phosphoethanolaminetransferase (alkaline phosphatase superfamily)